MAKIRVAVIGVGNMGKNHVRVYSQISDADLVAISDIDKGSVKSVASSCGAKWYIDYKKMLAKEEIDAVSIVVPTTKHEEVALDAIDYGKHVLLEKPIAGSIKSAEKIVQRADKAGVNLMVGHIERFNPVVARTKQLIDEGKLGQVVSISAKRVGPYANIKNDIGVCLDLAIHDIDVMRFITNDEVSEVYAKIGNNLCLNEDYASILLTLQKGATGLIDTNWLTPTKIRRLDVTGTQGYAALDYISQELNLYGSVLFKDYSEYEELTMAHGQPHMAKIKTDKEEPLKIELKHFIQSILKNKTPLVDGRTGVRNLEVALAAVQSAKKGRAISFAHASEA
jgi:UDP-N-acetylglucosamine 3-dehydrogenase